MRARPYARNARRSEAVTAERGRIDRTLDMIVGPPAGIQGFAARVIVGVALLAPWVWLVVLDRLLRRTR